MRRLTYIMLVMATLWAGPAHALVRIDLTTSNSNPLPVAVTDFTGDTPDGRSMGEQFKDVVKNDLARSGLFAPIDDKAFLQSGSSLKINGPIFNEWRMINAQILVSGTIEMLDNGTKVRAVYHMYDVVEEKEIAAKAYTADVKFWRYAAHRISDDIYTQVTGEGGYFTSRIVYIAQDKVPGMQTLRKRLCIMDSDGENSQCLTDGHALVLTPHFSPTVQQVVYMSYASGKPRLYLLDLPTGKQEMLGDFPGLNSAPRFSPDGKDVLLTLTMGHEGNSDIYKMNLETHKLTRLTYNRAIDTSASYSPDGKHIVFNSDREGRPALFIMDADGSNKHRLTFGAGNYYAPVWSPRGDLIAFVKSVGDHFDIGVIDPQGQEERLLTDSFLDESPSWSPNGRVIIFSRELPNGKTRIHTVDLTGYNDQEVPTPTDASDPAWSPLLH